MKKYFFFSLFISVSLLAVAQQKKHQLAKQLKFTTISQIGYLAGDALGAASFQLINGVTYKKWYAGAGVGIDYYLHRGFPLFADVRYHFSSKRNSIFLYADGGVHIPWEYRKGAGIETEQRSGLYTDAGFGYKLNQKNGNALVISFGYTHKQVKENRKEFLWLPAIRNVNIPQQTVRYHYGLNRIAIKFGLMF